MGASSLAMDSGNSKNHLQPSTKNMVVEQGDTATEHARRVDDQTKAVLNSLEPKSEIVMQSLEARNLIHVAMLPRIEKPAASPSDTTETSRRRDEVQEGATIHNEEARPNIGPETFHRDDLKTKESGAIVGQENTKNSSSGLE